MGEGFGWQERKGQAPGLGHDRRQKGQAGPEAGGPRLTSLLRVLCRNPGRALHSSEPGLSHRSCVDLGCGLQDSAVSGHIYVFWFALFFHISLLSPFTTRSTRGPERLSNSHQTPNSLWPNCDGVRSAPSRSLASALSCPTSPLAERWARPGRPVCRGARSTGTAAPQIWVQILL